MSVSKKFLNAWKYDPEEDSHQKRAGKALLPPGIQWRTAEAFAKLDTSKPRNVLQILAESGDAISLAAAATHGPIPEKSKPTTPAQSQDFTIPCEASPQGMVVVDSQGVELSASQGTKTCEDAAHSGMERQQKSPSDELQGVQESRHRTTHLWKKINPGCMPAYSNLPLSTTHDLMVVDYSDGKIPYVNKEYHRQKNDFTEYTEQGASTMKALISDKK